MDEQGIENNIILVEPPLDGSGDARIELDSKKPAIVTADEIERAAAENGESIFDAEQAARMEVVGIPHAEEGSLVESVHYVEAASEAGSGLGDGSGAVEDEGEALRAEPESGGAAVRGPGGCAEVGTEV